jgi:hypothetical protein
MTAARRLAAITVKWMQERTPILPTVFDDHRKTGLPEE